MNSDMIHSVVGFLGATLAWAFAKFANVSEFIPASLWQGGVTVVFISCLIYAVTHLNKALRDEREARMKDRTDFETILKDDLKAARESRELLNEVIKRNSDSLDNLAAKMGAEPSRHSGRIHLKDAR